jgi:SET domain-containing protein
MPAGQKTCATDHHDTITRMPTPRTLPKIKRRRSTVHGFGVFADVTIAKNTRIIDYAGELVRNRDCEPREERYLAEGCIWIFRVDRTWSRDAAIGGNIARFINHACQPNCWFEVVDKTIWIRASRTIRKGEELTYDYATVGERTIPCRCRPGCPNKL